MAFISEMLGKTVADFEGETIGSLDDLLAITQSKYLPPLDHWNCCKNFRRKKDN